MKKHGHYCKICGEYKANEKFSGKGHASHICKSCASLPAEKQAELMTLNRLLNLPWRLSKEQLSWLKNRLKDRRPDVRALAQEQYEMRFPPRHLEDDEFNFFDEESFMNSESGLLWQAVFFSGRRSDLWQPRESCRFMSARAAQKVGRSGHHRLCGQPKENR